MPRYRDSLRNAALDAHTANVGAAAKLQIWSGARPAVKTDAPAGALLAEFTLGSPYAPGAAAGVLSPTLPAAVVGLAAAGTGTAAGFARETTAAGVFVADYTLSIAGGGGEVQLAGLSLNIVNGQPVAVTSWTTTEGNP